MRVYWIRPVGFALACLLEGVCELSSNFLQVR